MSNTTATSTERGQVSHWLSRFEQALQGPDPAALRALFDAEGHWRDLLAFTWSITPHVGVDAVVGGLLATQARTGAHAFHLPQGRLAPRTVKRLGVDVVEAIFGFETRQGRGYGVLRLAKERPSTALLLMTSLEELHGVEEPINQRRPSGLEYSFTFGGDNWQDKRRKKALYDNRDPEVIVIGAGQAGLAVAARLQLQGADVLVVEKGERVGDNWRNRYHSLVLHNQTHANHLPYIPFPPNWPVYLPKDMVAGWFETYAWAMESNVWTRSTFTGGRYDEAAQRWEVTVARQDGADRVFRPRHLVFANGVSGLPYVPELPGIEDFRGEFLHSNSYNEGSRWKGKRVVVIGTGASGHDVAQDLHEIGAAVTLVQRGSTTVASIAPSAKLTYGIYDEGATLEDSDLLASASTYPMLVKTHQLLVQRMKEYDKELIAGLERRGFRHDYGEDETGHQMKFRRRGGGYYLNAGCSDLIVNGTIALVQNDDIRRFVAQGVAMKNGELIPADAIIAATGYFSQQELVRRLLGDAIADRIGPVWGVAEDGELANMYRPTAQPGLWFIGGSLAQCRIYSRHVALQIKARLAGLRSEAERAPASEAVPERRFARQQFA